ncbi:MAG: hypothetical protein V4568_14490 [Pseudomonadota bacterium]
MHMNLVRTVKQEDQDFDLFCECHNEPVDRIYYLAGEYGTEPFGVCLTTFLKEAEAS